jgi:hypothetical protein
MPLPEGVYFDGRRYVSFDGDSFDDHPCLADLLDRHVQEVNAEADAFNAEVAALEKRLRAEAQVTRLPTCGACGAASALAMPLNTQP